MRAISASRASPWADCQRLFQPRNLRPPVRLHLVVHAHRGGLVDAHHHRLAAIAAAGEVRHHILGDGLQPILAGDDVVLAAELALQLFLLRLVQLGGFEQRLQVAVQLLVGELHLGDAVLVVQRHRGAVLDGAGEVVDADVVAEHLARAFLLALDQRRAGKADEAGIGQGIAHIQRKDVVLAAVRLVGDDDHVGALRQQRVGLPRLVPELLDQREDVALVAAQQLFQVFATGGAHVLAGRRAGGLEGLGDLVVQLLAVGDDHEGGTAQHLAQHLLREEHHRQALARALRVPEHAQALALLLLGLAQLHQPRDGLVHAQELVVLGGLLDQPALALLEHREVLDVIQQPRRFQQPAQCALQRDLASLGLVIHALPVEEVLPGAGQRAHAGVRAVAEQDERIGVEQLRHRLAAVIAQVVVEGALQRHRWLLQLDEHQRQAVDEAQQIAAAPVHVAGHPHLRGQEELVVGRRGPVDDAQGLGAVPAVLVGHLHLHAVLQQPVEVAVRIDGDLLGAVLRELLDSLRVGVGRQTGVQRHQRRAQAAGEDHLRLAVAPLAALRAEAFRVEVGVGPAQGFQQADGRLLDQHPLAVAGANLADGLIRHALIPSVTEP